MSRIDITTSAAPLSEGMLQTANPLDATLQAVTDNVGNSSTVSLSTTETQINSILRIKTDNAELLDIENSSGNRFNINRDVQKVNLDFASNPTVNTSIVGAIRTFIDGTNLSDVAQFQENGQVTFTERVKLESDSTVTTQTSSVIQSSSTNANLVIAPNGTGALVANIPDGTAVGGNSRGTNAVDLQTSRTVNTQVASGVNSVVCGGANNSALGIADFVGGGANNSTSGYSDNFKTIVGGASNTITGGSGHSFIGGGQLNNINIGSGTGAGTISGGRSNSVTSQYSTVSGGQSNTASTGTHATVVGGTSNTASGQASVTGGQSNTASGNRATVFGTSNIVNGFESVVSGLQNTVSATRSFVTGYSNNVSGGHSIVVGWGNGSTSSFSGIIGINCFANGTSSFSIGDNTNTNGAQSFAQGLGSKTETANSSAFGDGGYTSLTNQQSLGNNISYLGDSQTSKVVYSINTGQVSTGGTYTFTGTELIVPKNNTYGSGVTQAYLCTAKFIYGARAKTGTVTTINNKDCFTSIYNFAAKSTLNVGALIGTPALQTSFSDANLTTTTISITIGASGNILFSFTPPTWIGGGTIEFRGTLSLEFTELGLY
jgi:hypothetical protein